MKKETNAEKPSKTLITVFLGVIALAILGSTIALAILGNCEGYEENKELIKVSYSQMTKPFLKYMTFKQHEDFRGLLHYEGITPDRKARLSVVGNKDNIRRASLEVDVRTDYWLYMMTSFLKVIFPKWKGRDAWLALALEKLLNSDDGRELVTVNKRIVEMGGGGNRRYLFVSWCKKSHCRATGDWDW